VDLSKKAKSRRDAVEAPLLSVEKILHDLEESRTRIDAAMTVWPETRRTLQPALSKQDAMAMKLVDLKKELSCLWEQGHKSKWKE
jgi:hypothetical protein